MSCFTPEFIAKIASEFDLNESRLQDVLSIAEEEHDAQILVEFGREDFKDCAKHFKMTKKALHRSVREFQNFTDGEKKRIRIL